MRHPSRGAELHAGRSTDATSRNIELTHIDGLAGVVPQPSVGTAGRGVEPLHEAWLRRLRAGLSGGGLCLLARPLVRAGDGAPAGWELLARLRDESDGLLAPDRFGPMAARLGLTGEIDRWTVAHTVRLLADRTALRGAGQPADAPVAVTLSGHALGDPLLLALLEGAAADPALDLSRLVLQLHDLAVVDDRAAARAFADRLVGLGCRLGLADFCTGFAPLHSLTRLPVGRLMIDAAFVARCATDRTDRVVIETVTRLARSLGRETVAEGVPDRATAAALAELGVDLLCGDWVGAAEPV